MSARDAIAFGNALGDGIVDRMQSSTVAGGSGLKVKGSTAASWGPTFNVGDGTVPPTSYALDGTGVRLGGAGSEAVASARASSTVSAEQFERYFGPSPRVFGVDRPLAGTTARAGHPNSGGGWVGEGRTGIQNIGSVSSTRFALDDLPAQYQTAYGAVKSAHDAVGQGYLAVPVNSAGTVKFYSPPADYEVPSLSTLQGRAWGRGGVGAWGRGLAAGMASAPGAARDLLEAGVDFMDGVFNPNAQAQSPIPVAIRDGRVTSSSLLYGLIESSPVGILTNIGIGSPESVYGAGQAIGGAAVFGAAGLTLSAGTRLSARFGSSPLAPLDAVTSAAGTTPGTDLA